MSRLALLGLVIAAGAGLVWLALAGAPGSGLSGGAPSGLRGAGRGNGGGEGRGTGGGTGGGAGGHRGAAPPVDAPGGVVPGVPHRRGDPNARAAGRAAPHDPGFDWREQVAERLAPELLVSALADFVDADGVVDDRRVKSAFPGSQTERPGDTAGDEPRMVRQGVPRAVKHFVFARVEDPEQVRWIAATKPEPRKVGGKPAWAVRVRFSAPDLEPVRQDRLFFLQHDAVVWVTDVKERQ
ncbi:MAG: hypothetical protein ACYTGX_08610 [Planctomycetota bacterium]